MAEESKPIWKAVAASVITAAITGLGSVIWNSVNFRAAYQVPLWLGLLLAAAVAGIVFIVTYILVHRGHDVPVTGQSVSVSNSYASLANDPSLNYPLKYHVEFRNRSPEDIEVRFLRYEPNMLQATRFVRHALQVRTATGWHPEPSTDRISVRPSDVFRAWIPLDDKKLKKTDAVNSLRGTVGTFVLEIDQREMSFKV